MDFNLGLTDRVGMDVLTKTSMKRMNIDDHMGGREMDHSRV